MESYCLKFKLKAVTFTLTTKKGAIRMTSEARRDPQNDNLLTPENSVFLLIDYQPVQIDSVSSVPRGELLDHIEETVKLMNLYKVPTVLSTVNVGTHRNQDTIPRLRSLLPDNVSYDRTTINAWENVEFKQAVKATGRKKLIIAGLWTEACLAFPTLDALKEGYEVFPVVDAVGGTSTVAHEIALRRIEQAGAQLTSIAQLACELQRDWNRSETAGDYVQLMAEGGMFQNF